jgi:hypothetical protein
MDLSRIARKFNLQHISKIVLFPIQMELELGMLGVVRKPLKGVIHLLRK